jgi:hypothetical protein
VNSVDVIEGSATPGFRIRDALHRAGIIVILLIIAKVNPLLERLLELRHIVFIHPVP